MKKTKEEMEISPSESCSIWSHRHFVLAVIAKFLYCAAQTGIFDIRALYCTGLFIVAVINISSSDLIRSLDVLNFSAYSLSSKKSLNNNSTICTVNFICLKLFLLKIT